MHAGFGNIIPVQLDAVDARDVPMAVLQHRLDDAPSVEAKMVVELEIHQLLKVPLRLSSAPTH